MIEWHIIAIVLLTLGCVWAELMKNK